jgi:hypothetical protein
VQDICARQKVPPFDRLWIDYIQEEARIESNNGKQRGIDDENIVRNNRCAPLTIDNIEILSPNHRPKPPPSTLTLIENNSGRKP